MTDKKADGEAAVQAAIAAMAEPDRDIGGRLHAIITANAPDLAPRTWYGMPAYARDNGKIICFFRPRERFGEHYLTLGFNDAAQLDDGRMWPINFALTELGRAEEAAVTELVKKAVGK